jgi:hypothetical protein
MYPLPSEDMVEAAADVVVAVLTPYLEGKNRLRRKMIAMSVARLALRTAWFWPHATPKPNNPYTRWCVNCCKAVTAHYTSHPSIPHVNAMLCPACNEVTRPIIKK